MNSSNFDCGLAVCAHRPVVPRDFDVSTGGVQHLPSCCRTWPHADCNASESIDFKFSSMMIITGYSQKLIRRPRGESDAIDDHRPSFRRV